jgi:hypothetical protein
MTEFLADIPRWVTNLAFWISLLTLLGCAYGVHRSFKGSRAEINKALDDLYALMDALHAEQDTPASPLSAPVSPSDNVRDIPTTRTAVARTDEAVEGLKATIGLPTDPNKLTHQPPAPTEAIPALGPDHIGGSVGDDSWAYVLNPDHRIEIVDGEPIPAFRDPDDTPSPAQLESPTNPSFNALPTTKVRLVTDDPVIAGRHRHPEDDE